jgi:6,7-dimethyl-8-ribityllumazine synthase
MRHFDASFETGLNADGLRFAVVASRYNRPVVDALLDSALAALREAGAADEDVLVVRVPGAWEIPAAMRTLLEEEDVDAGIAIGAVIRGDTPHFEFVARGCADGLMEVSLASGVPVAFGVLTVDNQAQADERSRPDETNKGREAALTAIEMATLNRHLRDET